MGILVWSVPNGRKFNDVPPPEAKKVIPPPPTIGDVVPIPRLSVTKGKFGLLGAGKTNPEPLATT
jgi:hypothetical protein